MKKRIKVFHYLNQFFGEIGAEDKADTPLEFQQKAVGPGKELGRLLGESFVISTTAICGDNYFQENQDDVLKRIAQKLQQEKVDLILAGPAFGAGRYGVAGGAVCQYLSDLLGIPALTAFSPDNPAAEMYRRNQTIYILPTTKTVRGMQDALVRMAAFAHKVVSQKELGAAQVEGYLPRGIRKVISREKSGAQRAIEMLEARLQGRSYTSELVLPVFEQVRPPKPVTELASAKLAFITTAGVVPKGNPDKMKALNTDNWALYPLELLSGGDYECIHGGINPDHLNARAEYVVPLHTADKFRERGVIGSIFNNYFVSAGCGGVIKTFQRMGREMAAALKENHIDAVILTST